jgi:hypothetical protein
VVRKGEIDRAGKYAALLSMTEVGLGSVLHAWRVPMAGHFLSLNQGFLLCRSTRSASGQGLWLPFQISGIAAALKSLAPAGKRLTPMLAISMQGFLFSLGRLFFGRGFAGCAVGMSFLCLWSYIQPAMIYLLVFGHGILEAGQYFLESLQPIVPITLDQIVWALIVAASLKILLGVALAYIAVYRPRSETSETYARLLAKSEAPIFSKQVKTELTPVQKAQLLLKDLMQPWFLLSLVMMGLFFVLTRPQDVTLMWFLLRPIAVGVLVFYCLRFLPVDVWILRVCGNSETAFPRILARTVQRLKVDA